ncbi:ATP-dependent zinc protease [Candidatus Saccharibacteria bacterium]|nr:ATP-dependent zinc protease [Candidatus Saccharibacteria bacterium]
MAVQNPLVIFVFSKQGNPGSTRYDGFARRLKKYGNLEGVETLTCALENLLFTISEDGTAQIVDLRSGINFNTASMVYLKSWESMPEEACATTLYLEHRGIPYVDGLPKHVGISKLSQMFRMWSAGIRVPTTYFVRNHQLLSEFLSEQPNTFWPLIMKDAFGEKGKSNYLAHNLKEATGILARNPDITFICQRFVPNLGDYRVGVYMGKASFGLLRQGDGSTHLNNTSAGGAATYMKPSELPVGMAALAEEAAVAADLKIAGVDVMIDSKTNKPLILEVNQGSQIVTGVNIEENIVAFTSALSSSLKHRHTREKTKPMSTVGRRAYVALPELGVDSIVAKIDSGAYTSALHAENIVITKDENGAEILNFDVIPGDKIKITDNQVKRVSTSDFFKQVVTSSNGHEEERFTIRTRLVIEGRTFRATLTLTDRSSMSHPLLIGRKILRSRFLVNVELSEFNRAEWNY